MSNQLCRVLDANGDGQVSLEEWEAFDWGHIVDKLKEGLEAENKEMGHHLAGEWRLDGKVFTRKPGDILMTEMLEEKWEGTVQISEDGSFSSSDLLSSIAGPVSLDEDSKIDEDGQLSATITFKFGGKHFYKGPIDVSSEGGGVFSISGGKCGPEILGEDSPSRVYWTFFKQNDGGEEEDSVFV